jgi:hypothetical protein
MAIESWDKIDYNDYSGVPELSCGTDGCGCCADGRGVSDFKEAVATLEQHISEKQTEFRELTEWLHRLKTSGRIVE